MQIVYFRFNSAILRDSKRKKLSNIDCIVIKYDSTDKIMFFFLSQDLRSKISPGENITFHYTTLAICSAIKRYSTRNINMPMSFVIFLRNKTNMHHRPKRPNFILWIYFVFKGLGHTNKYCQGLFWNYFMGAFS